MLRERLTCHKSISFTEKMAEDIQALADKLDVHFADIVRACVEYDLPKFKERIRKRKNSRKD
ncbi:MAG: hypothetical protein OXU23_05070 [Candidatus Poribacteria bacterium]|nr:hypothetical protein [Candidatus Poribacteria bacterium]